MLQKQIEFGAPTRSDALLFKKHSLLLMNVPCSRNWANKKTWTRSYVRFFREQYHFYLEETRSCSMNYFHSDWRLGSV